METTRGESEFVELRYSSEYQPLAQNLTGKKFEHVFGKNTSVLEILLIQLKLKGPQWFTVKKCKEVTLTKKSWCDFEITVQSPKDIEQKLENSRKDPPNLKVMSIAIKSFKNLKKTKEICAVSLVVHNNVECDKNTNDAQKGYSSVTLIRKLENKPWPYQFQNALDKSRKKITKFETEKALLENLVIRISKVDPDLIVAHGLCQGMFDTLLDRIDKNKVNMWSRIARFKRSTIPKNTKKEGFSFGSFFIPRQATVGRLICDTFLSARELVRETNYDLCYLAKVQLNVNHAEFDPNMITQIYGSKAENLMGMIKHTEDDAMLTLDLMFKLAVVPLTKQLTNIAGNLWIRSLQNARAERNEWLLVHEFTQKGFICPDKEYAKKHVQKDEEEEDDDHDDEKPGRRKKAAYEGGLVLEPKPGLYDKIVMLLDFNSLYPSIIQEYNLCFTTVDRVVTQNYDGTPASDGRIDEVDVPMADTSNAILPGILKMLVEKRKMVKKELKNEKDEGKREQLDIKQKAIKLTANSIYGCLGFSSSRFYAKAIAALITRKGREALKGTVDIAGSLGYNVVYGDTDSVMIATGSDNLKEALSIGEKIKADVNKRYKCLEIEIDGVFRSLLLLKKKKYAALVYQDLNDPNSFNKREIKGLDMVRRDWCKLSKEIGGKVLKEILSANNMDDIQINLRQLFTYYAEEIKNKRIALSYFIITKQLTRAPSEYTKAENLPHVVVAKRMMEEEGKSTTELVGSYIKYVICEDQNATSSALKAHKPEDLMKKDSNLQIDIDWYLSQQIYPPIERLIQYIDGIDGKFICDCFGIDSKKHTNMTSAYQPENKDEETVHEKFLNVAKNKDSLDLFKSLTKYTLSVRDMSQIIHDMDSKMKTDAKDKKFIEFPGLIHQRSSSFADYLAGIVDKTTLQKYPRAYIKNRVKLLVKNMLKDYYSGEYECVESSCAMKTYSYKANSCMHNSKPTKIGEKGVADTFNYLERLFDVTKKPKNINEDQKKLIDECLDDHLKDYSDINNRIKAMRKYNGYDVVELKSIFSFMNAYKEDPAE